MSEILWSEHTSSHENKKWICATLNAESSLNALSQNMINSMLERWTDFQQNPAYVGWILKGSGPKAFCAGGDIRALYKAMVNQQWTEADRFFETEYKLDLAIHESKKPVVVLGHGVVMGGGMGLLNGATVRVVTESTKMAMPEITIGLYPEVGGTYFLSRLPGKLGLFLGLTGFRFNAKDALDLGLADLFVSNANTENFEKLVVQCSSKEALETLVAQWKKQPTPELPTGLIESRRNAIEDLLSGPIETLLQKLETATSTDPLLQSALDSFKKGSPLSAKCIVEQWIRGKKLSKAQAFAQELRWSSNMARHGDFQEGVRALLIDKDQKPKWKHRSTALVPQDAVEKICNSSQLP